MFATIRRHQSWLLILIAVVIIISFVVFFSPNVRLGDMTDRMNFGSLNGKDITREQYMNALRETHIFFFARYGEWPGREEAMRQIGFDVENETYNRLLLTELMREHQIDPTSEAVAQWIRELFTGPGGQPFSYEAYERFVRETLNPQGFTAQDFNRFARNEVGRQHLIALIGMSGKFIVPEEAETVFRRENETIATDVVFFNYTNYLENVEVTPEAVGQYYTNNMAQYRLPPRVQVDYLKFDATNFLAEADQRLERFLAQEEQQRAGITNLNALVEMYYERRGGTNYYVDEFGAPLELDQAREKIVDEVRRQFALIPARIKASEFITELLDLHDQRPPEPSDFANLAAAKGLEVHTTAPFDQQTGPEELDVPPQFQSRAFALTPQEPFTTSAVMAEDGAYVLHLNRRLPSEIQPFEAVEERVIEDYRRTEAVRHARQAGEQFSARLQESLAAGRSFQEIVLETGATVESLPPFSIATRSMPELGERVNLGLLQNLTTNLKPGESSSFIQRPQGGLVVYVRDRSPVEEEKLREDLPEFLTNLRESRQFAAFADWFQRQAQNMRLIRPLREETAG
jgi:hypothetical protein